MDEVACVNDQLARCAQGQFELIPCNAGLVYVPVDFGNPTALIKCNAKMSCIAQDRFPRDFNWMCPGE